MPKRSRRAGRLAHGTSGPLHQVSAILLGAVVLGERLDPQHFVGMALIGCGLAAIDGRLRAFLQRRRRPSPEVYRGRDI